MKEKLRVFVVVMFFAFLISACGGTGSRSIPQTEPKSVSVGVFPTDVALDTGSTQQFTAVVSNTDDDSVEWQVNSTTGGDSIVGTISTSGLYTTPDQAPPNPIVKVTAVSQADPTKSGSTSVTIFGPGTVRISPPQATIPAGETQQFTASILGDSNAFFSWGVDDSGLGSTELGTISDSGLYTAPSLPPPGGP